MPGRLRGVRAAVWAMSLLAGASAALVVGRIEMRDVGTSLPELLVPAVPHAISPPRALTAGDPWNVILVSIDTLRADHLSLYGYRRETSPSLDAFARDALVFEHAYSQSPKTAESHMTLMTGLYPVAHGVRNLRASNAPLSEEIPTLAAILQRAGYRTAGYHGAGNLDAELGFDRGFDVYEHPGGADAVFGSGREWLEAQAREPARAPFFLFLHTKVLHDPYEPPPEYSALFADPSYAGRIGLSQEERRSARRQGGYWLRHRLYWERVDPRDPGDVQHLRDLYDALIRYMDDALGPFLDRFRQLDFGRDTLLVFLSDHGEEFMEHRGFRHGSVYREVLHVPLVVRLPERSIGAARGRRVQAVVSLVDVMPTLLDLLGLESPAHVQGRSFEPLLRGRRISRRPVYSEWAERRARALRAGDWKYVRTPVSEELYHLAEDPGEQRNLIRHHPRIAARLRDQVARMASAVEGFSAVAPAGQRFGLDARVRDQLEALGYLGGGN